MAAINVNQLPFEAKTEIQIRDELNNCRDNCHRFITHWVKIEDKDTPGIVIPFTLWPRQVQTLTAFLSYRLLVVLKARQLGLSWLVLAYAVWKMVFNPGYTVIVLSKTEDDAKELVRRVKFILEKLPLWIIRDRKDVAGNFAGPTFTSTTETITIFHRNSEPSALKSMPAAPGAGRTFTANLVILDEWAYQQWAYEIWASAYPTINRPGGGQVIGVSSNKRGSLFEVICQQAMEEKSNFKFVFLPWRSDPKRTQEWYEQTKIDLPSSYLTEYPATPEEAFSAGENTAFPEFSREIHVCKPFAIPSWWKRWRCNDPGYADPFCWHWMAVSETGIVYVYREYSRSPKDERVTYGNQAGHVLEKSYTNEIDENGKLVPEDISFTVVGRDAWNKQGRAFATGNKPLEGKSIIDCYRESNLAGCIPPPTEQSAARIIRKAIFHEYLRPFQDELTDRTIARLQIFSTCHALIEALSNLVVDDNDNEKVALEPHIYTAAFDCAGYGLVTFHTRKSKPPEKEKTVIQLDKERLMRIQKRNRRKIV
jgi:hypothetical protein